MGMPATIGFIFQDKGASAIRLCLDVQRWRLALPRSFALVELGGGGLRGADVVPWGRLELITATPQAGTL
jgi:hypothetical protein